MSRVPARPAPPADPLSSITIFLSVSERDAVVRALRGLAPRRRDALLRALAIDADSPPRATDASRGGTR